MTPAFFLDVNVPMYAAGTDHPYKAACVWLMKEVAEGRLAVAIDTEIVQEVLHRYSAVRRWETGLVLASSLLDLVPTVFPVTIADIRLTVEIFRRCAPQGVTARDALHAAVMQGNGLTRILSVDQHFDQIEGISRVNVGTVAQTRLEVES